MVMQQIKSKQRVTDYGEVFTSEREVKAMLDLVKQEANKIESRFLEPSCGTGNFLIEILQRKLKIVQARYVKNRVTYEQYAILAVSTIYGIDILEDNINYCRERLFNFVRSAYLQIYGDDCSHKYQRSIQFILNRNIIWGDFLTMQSVDGTETPIVFVEWFGTNNNHHNSVDSIPYFGSRAEQYVKNELQP